ncbi:MAG TPA: UbiA-like polyprenyltransferase [bacterium]|nr:UbiA-like polyprenyltransferase [bacterium]
MTTDAPASPPLPPLAARWAAICADIKLAHTVFALPFALLAAHLAFLREGGYSWRLFWLVLAAMVTARTAAMAFNRWLDRDIDARNPRTQSRAIPAGQARPVDMALFTAIACALFVLVAWRINPLAFALSPVALAIVLGYSYAKRFTSLAHLWLGFSLAIAPMGAWIAVTGAFAPEPFWLVLAVLTWVGGFDVLYSCQDVRFDASEGLHSIPQTVGIPRALAISAALHVLTVLALVGFGWSMALGAIYYGTVAIIAAILLWEHRIVTPTDLSRINVAFFTLNGLVSVLLYAGVLLDTWLL